VVTVSFVPDVAQCTAAARVFPELGRWRWARFAQGTVALGVAVGAGLLVGPGPWLVGTLALAGIVIWTMLTVLGPWYAPRRLRGTFWIGELVTCEIGPTTISWWSQPGLRQLSWHQIEAVGTREGVLALRTGPPYQLIWVPTALLTRDQVLQLIRRAAAIGADTRRVTLDGARANAPEPEAVSAGVRGGSHADRPDDRWHGGWSTGGGGQMPGSAPRALEPFERPGSATASDGLPIMITGTVSRAQALALQRPTHRLARRMAAVACAGIALVTAGAVAGLELSAQYRAGVLALIAATPLLAWSGRALGRRLAARRLLREVGSEPVHWLADAEGLTTVTPAGRTFAPRACW
jgi:hypothetical protein